MLHLHEGPVESPMTERISREKKPSTQRDSSRLPLGYKACVLLLCYNYCPGNELLLITSRQLQLFSYEFIINILYLHESSG